MESFIRSKYESKRWAMEGPPPSDPTILEGGTSEEAAAPVVPALPSPSSSRPVHAATSSTSSARAAVTNRQPQPHQLISATVAGRTPQATQAAIAPPQQQAQAPAAAAPAAPAPANDLFSLDFHNPTPPAAAPAQRKDVKQDILSLFSTQAPAAAPAQQAFGQFGGMPAAMPPQQNVWGGFAGAPAAAAPQMAAPAQPFGNTGAGSWGAPQPNMWAAPAQPAAAPAQTSLFNTNDIWASNGGQNSAAAGGGDLFGSSLPAKKDDVFGDIWGGFK